MHRHIDHPEHHEHGDRRGRRGDFGPWGPGFDGRGRGGPRGGQRGRGGRARRGNVKSAILALLAERPMHGYEMIGELDTRTGGIWRPSPGSIYPTLQLLEDEGMVTSEEQGGKRLFTVTDTGREEAASNPEPWQEVTDEAGASAPQAREAIGQLVMALKQVMMAGSETQQAKALDVIVEARRKLYGILADDPAAE
ncbi:MAG: PadR family transcriptional regulator [Streptosporangiaceae bacterium]